MGCSNIPDHFFRSKLVPCKHSLRECVKISWNRTKQEWYHLLTSTGKNQRLSHHINFSSFVMTAHMDFTHPVLSLLAFVPARLKYSQDYQCSMSREIHHLQLKFASFFVFCFNLWMNVWRIQQ